MKIFSFVHGVDGPNLAEQVTLEVGSEELRNLSSFLSRCADEMDGDKDWEHEHFCDYLGEELKCDLVVYNVAFAKN